MRCSFLSDHWLGTVTSCSLTLVAWQPHSDNKTPGKLTCFPTQKKKKKIRVHSLRRGYVVGRRLTEGLITSSCTFSLVWPSTKQAWLCKGVGGQFWPLNHVTASLTPNGRSGHLHSGIWASGGRMNPEINTLKKLQLCFGQRERKTTAVVPHLLFFFFFLNQNTLKHPKQHFVSTTALHYLLAGVFHL